MWPNAGCALGVCSLCSLFGPPAVLCGLVTGWSGPEFALTWLVAVVALQGSECLLFDMQPVFHWSTFTDPRSDPKVGLLFFRFTFLYLIACSQSVTCWMPPPYLGIAVARNIFEMHQQCWCTFTQLSFSSNSLCRLKATSSLHQQLLLPLTVLYVGQVALCESTHDCDGHRKTVTDCHPHFPQSITGKHQHQWEHVLHNSGRIFVFEKVRNEADSTWMQGVCFSRFLFYYLS